jgi:hypothetical protein
MKKRQGRSVPSHGRWVPTGDSESWLHEVGVDRKSGKQRVKHVLVHRYTLLTRPNRYSRGNWGGQAKEKARAARRISWSQ